MCKNNLLIWLIRFDISIDSWTSSTDSLLFNINLRSIAALINISILISCGIVAADAADVSGAADAADVSSAADAADAADVSDVSDFLKYFIQFSIYNIHIF